MVRFDTEWHHVVSLIADGEGGAAFAMVLETARFATDLELGVELKAREPVDTGVESRDARLVGEDSVEGNSPRGCWRVATMFRMQTKQQRYSRRTQGD